MMEEIVMTESQFVDYLNNVKGCQFVNVMALTDADMNKGRGKNKNPYYGRVKKFSVVRMQFGYNYVNAVNNRLEKEGKERTYTGEKLPWGKWETFNKIIKHDGNYYIRTYNVPKHIGHTYYLLDGERVTPEQLAEIKPYIKEDDGFCQKQENIANISVIFTKKSVKKPKKSKKMKKVVLTKYKIML